MELIDILKRNPNLTLKDFQELQGTYDGKFVAQKFSGFDKIRHTYAHMGKLMGRLAEYIHDMEEQEEGNVSSEDIEIKVIPDLLVYSAWLAEEFSIDIEEAGLKRFVGNLRRLHADKVPVEELEELERYVKERFEV